MRQKLLSDHQPIKQDLNQSVCLRCCLSEGNLCLSIATLSSGTAVLFRHLRREISEWHHAQVCLQTPVITVSTESNEEPLECIGKDI